MIDRKQLDTADKQSLTQNRITLGFYFVSLACWLTLLGKTYMGSKLPFVFLISSVFILYYVNQICMTLVYNWANFGWTQGVST